MENLTLFQNFQVETNKVSNGVIPAIFGRIGIMQYMQNSGKVLDMYLSAKEIIKLLPSLHNGKLWLNHERNHDVGFTLNPEYDQNSGLLRGNVKFNKPEMLQRFIDDNYRYLSLAYQANVLHQGGVWIDKLGTMGLVGSKYNYHCQQVNLVHDHTGLVQLPRAGQISQLLILNSSSVVLDSDVDINDKIDPKFTDTKENAVMPKFYKGHEVSEAVYELLINADESLSKQVKIANDLQSELDEIENQGIEDLKSTVELLSNSIKEKDTKIAELETSLTENKTAIAELQKTIENSKEENENKLSEMEKSVKAEFQDRIDVINQLSQWKEKGVINFETDDVSIENSAIEMKLAVINGISPELLEGVNKEDAVLVSATYRTAVVMLNNSATAKTTAVANGKKSPLGSLIFLANHSTARPSDPSNPARIRTQHIQNGQDTDSSDAAREKMIATRKENKWKR